MQLAGKILRLLPSNSPRPSASRLGTGPVWKAIRSWAETSPQAMAAVTADGSMTYAQLWSQCLDLAAAIAGVSPDADGAVAALAPQGLVHLQTILACKLLGRMYVPMDIDDPPLYNRRNAVLTGTSVVVCRTADKVLARELAPNVEVVVADMVARGYGFRPPEGQEQERHRPSTLLFTSGSSGIPKGVVYGSESTGPRLSVVQESLACGPGDTVAMFTVPTTVLSAAMLAPLTAGSSILLQSPRANPQRLLSMMADHGAVTQMTCGIGLMRTLVQVDGAMAAFAKLRRIWLVGGRISGLDVASIRRVAPAAIEIGASYSSTEASRISALLIPPHVDPGSDTLPIGTHSAEVELWLGCDPDDPEGDTGEVFVSSNRLACGYWRDDAATAKAFFPHPVDPTRRLFRTGDIVKIAGNGDIRIIGRRDNQVKLRGWRVELEGVEAAACTVGGVESVGVVPRLGESGEIETLVLYLSGRNGGPALVEAAMDAIRSVLPKPSWPTEAHSLDDFPLTATGKVDRSRLASADAALRRRRQSAGGTACWPGAVSEQIAAIVAEELRCDRLELDLPFLHAYGDSLKALNIALRIEEGFDTTIDPAILFDATPLKEVIALIAEQIRHHAH